MFRLFWRFYIISLTLSNIYRKMHVQEKSGSGWLVGTRPLFLRLGSFFGIFGVFSHYFSGDAVVGIIFSLNNMKSTWTLLHKRGQIGHFFNLPLATLSTESVDDTIWHFLLIWFKGGYPLLKCLNFLTDCWATVLWNMWWISSNLGSGFVYCWGVLTCVLCLPRGFLHSS